MIKNGTPVKETSCIATTAEAPSRIDCSLEKLLTFERMKPELIAQDAIEKAKTESDNSKIPAMD